MTSSSPSETLEEFLALLSKTLPLPSRSHVSLVLRLVKEGDPWLSTKSVLGLFPFFSSHPSLILRVKKLLIAKLASTGDRMRAKVLTEIALSPSALNDGDQVARLINEALGTTENLPDPKKSEALAIVVTALDRLDGGPATAPLLMRVLGLAEVVTERHVALAAFESATRAARSLADPAAANAVLESASSLAEAIILLECYENSAHAAVAMVFAQRGDLKRALLELDKAFAAMEQLPDDWLKGKAIHGIITTALFLPDPAQVDVVLTRATSHIDAMSDPAPKCIALTQVAEKRGLTKTADAVTLFEKAMDVASVVDSTFSRVLQYGDIAKATHVVKDPIQVAALLRRLMTLSPSPDNDNSYLASTLEAIAEVAGAIRSPELAAGVLRDLRQALKFLSRTEAPVPLAAMAKAFAKATTPTEAVAFFSESLNALDVMDSWNDSVLVVAKTLSAFDGAPGTAALLTKVLTQAETLSDGYKKLEILAEIARAYASFHEHEATALLETAVEMIERTSLRDPEEYEKCHDPAEEERREKYEKYFGTPVKAEHPSIAIAEVLVLNNQRTLASTLLTKTMTAIMGSTLDGARKFNALASLALAFSSMGDLNQAETALINASLQADELSTSDLKSPALMTIAEVCSQVARSLKTTDTDAALKLL